MVLSNIGLTLLFLSAIEATNNQFVRTDTSAPELEIDQRDYNNPTSMNKHTENSTIEESSSTHTVTNDRKQESKKEETGEVNSRDKVDRYSDDGTLHSTLKVIDINEDSNKITENDDEPISVVSYDIPKIPKRVIGPQKKPFRPPPFNGVGPKGIDEVDKPSCNAFSRTARFNPYSVLDVKWFNFYRWDSRNTALVIEFQAPTSWELDDIRKRLEPHLEHPVNWDSRIVIMVDLIYNASSLLVERSDHGQFWLYPILQNYTFKVEALDVRFKQTADNRYIAFVICYDDRAYIFSRINEIPRKKYILDAVATLGWRGRDGRSYLYQGHKWTPIPEITEEEYWTPIKYGKREELPPPPEPYDPDTDPVKIFNRKFY